MRAWHQADAGVTDAAIAELKEAKAQLAALGSDDVKKFELKTPKVRPRSTTSIAFEAPFHALANVSFPTSPVQRAD